MDTDNIEEKSHSEFNSQQITYTEITRSIIGGASIGAIIGTPLGFVGSAVAAVFGIVLAPVLLLSGNVTPDNPNSKGQADES